MSIAWFLAIIILVFAQCRPLKAYWLLELQALPTTHCIDTVLAFLCNSIVNSVIDFLTLTLPIKEVLKLQTTRRRKLSLCFVFLLGSSALAASLIRTISSGLLWVNGATDFSKQFVLSGYATMIEVYVGIIGSCLPNLMPVYCKARYGNPFGSSASGPSKPPPIGGNGDLYNSRLRNRGRFGHRLGSFERFGDSQDALALADHRDNHNVDISSSLEGQTHSTDTEMFPLEGVMIRQDVVVSSPK
ncbi:hypothetical protein GGR56DRAFT_678799 [Xylariaceae sp. FL0804]|nr:hypothetical protein GGR56DRAFT_678799 [Xylariaceae sp. FL0804]